MQVQLLLYVFLALLGKMDADKFEGSDGRFIGFLLSFLTLFLTISAFILVNIPMHASGRPAWGDHRTKGFAPRSFSDGRVEEGGVLRINR